MVRATRLLFWPVEAAGQVRVALLMMSRLLKVCGPMTVSGAVAKDNVLAIEEAVLVARLMVTFVVRIVVSCERSGAGGSQEDAVVAVGNGETRRVGWPSWKALPQA